VRPGGGGNVLIEVDRGHPAMRARQVRQQGRVVAGPGADLQHPMSDGDSGLFKHYRHDRRLRRRTDASPAAFRLVDTTLLAYA
jgi:hypothetical protein